MKVKIELNTIAGSYFKWFEVRSKCNGDCLIKVPEEDKPRWIHSSQIKGYKE